MSLRTIALNDLRRRKGRAVFLVAGLLIGIGTVVALVSLTEAMTGQTKANLQSYGANIIVTPRTRDVSLSYGGISVGGLSVGQNVVREADLARIESIPARAE